MWEILSKVCEWCVGLGMVAIVFGIPAFFFKQLVINPLFIMRREIKAGKSFPQAFKVGVKSLTRGDITLQRTPYYRTETYNEYCNRNYLSSPNYSHIPGNIYHR